MGCGSSRSARRSTARSGPRRACRISRRPRQPPGSEEAYLADVTRARPAPAAADVAEHEVADHQDRDPDHDVLDVRPGEDAPHHRAEQRAEPGPEAPVDDAGGKHAPGELHERDLRGPTDERHGDPEAGNEPTDEDRDEAACGDPYLPLVHAFRIDVDPARDPMRRRIAVLPRDEVGDERAERRRGRAREDDEREAGEVAARAVAVEHDHEIARRGQRHAGLLGRDDAEEREVLMLGDDREHDGDALAEDPIQLGHRARARAARPGSSRPSCAASHPVAAVRARTSTPVSTPIPSSIQTRSSVARLPPAPFANGEPPIPPMLASTTTTPSSIATSTFARPCPYVSWKR